ncbi:MAG: rhodanese-like domain-containing protein, partial [Polyangiaceae bacterium]
MATTYTDLLATTRKTTRELPLADLKKRLDAGDKFTLVDVREKEEYRAGFIPGAISLPRGFLESQAETKLPDKNAKIVVYCAGGNRSAFAAKSLAELGYSHVETVNPGFTRWKDSGFQIEQPPQLTDAQRDRYSRHIMLPEVGEVGQEKLLK